jgi:hypothetical protein
MPGGAQPSRASSWNVASYHTLTHQAGAVLQGSQPMEKTASCNSAAGTNRLAELLTKAFGCADVIAPVDELEFGRRAGELIVQGVGKRVPFVDARIRQYYSTLARDAPREFIPRLRRQLGKQRLPHEEPKIDRVRPGGPLRVRMPSLRPAQLKHEKGEDQRESTKEHA